MHEQKKNAREYRGFFKPSEEVDRLFERELAERPGYPDERRFEVRLALTEAWSWLEAQGLIVPDPNSGQAGFKQLSRRARKFESKADLANFRATRLLPKEILHPAMADRVWGAFVRGEFDMAAFQAMRAVEVAVREASQLSAKEIGTSLMRTAFDPKKGPLADQTAEMGEREARSSLFSGAIGSYKNPLSHREVNLGDPVEALEIILLANHLLRIVDGRKLGLRGN
jgi:uncharacterized protein (TIGR02391 family)